MKKILTIIMSASIIIYGVGFISQKGIIDLNVIGDNEITNRIDDRMLVTEVSTKTNSDLLLVNYKNGLSKNYKPELSIPNISFAEGLEEEEMYVAKEVVEPLEQLINAASEEGITLLMNSGYRAYNTQKKIYKERTKSQGQGMAELYVAKPGYSEHQTGLAVDITNEYGYFVEGTEEAKWLADNCYKFGFIIRYPKEKQDITHIEYEPWHIRYVGQEPAKYIYDNDITLEEYLGK